MNARRWLIDCALRLFMELEAIHWKRQDLLVNLRCFAREKTRFKAADFVKTVTIDISVITFEGPLCEMMKRHQQKFTKLTLSTTWLTLWSQPHNSHLNITFPSKSSEQTTRRDNAPPIKSSVTIKYFPVLMKNGKTYFSSPTTCVLF